MNLLSKRKKESHHLAAEMQLGKDGATESFVQELKKRIKQDSMVKVRLGKAARTHEDKKALADMLAKATNTMVVRQIGFVVVLARR